MAGTMVYMLALLALASGMVVLMFGFFSSTHNSMYTLQSSFDEHERLLRRVRQADTEMTGQVSELRRTVEDLRSKLRLQQAAIDTHGEALTKAAATHERSSSKVDAAQGEVSKQVQELSKQVQDILEDVGQMRGELQQVSTLQEDLRVQSQGDKENSAMDTRLAALEGKISELASKQQTLFGLLNSHDEAEHRLQELVKHLNNTVGEMQLLPSSPKPGASLPTVRPSSSKPAIVLAGRARAGEEQQPSSHASNMGLGGPEDARPSSTGKQTVASGKQVVSQKAKAASSVVAWYRECGCTGMEIEAVTLLVSLVSRTGAARVRTNKCSDTCAWPASTRALLDRIEVEEESRLADPAQQSSSGEQGDTSSATIVLVVHAAFNGVCMIPTSLILSERSGEDLISEPQRGLFRVSRSMLETDRVDEDKVRTCNEQFDAVWVPSQFNVRTFSKSGVKKSMLHVLPEAVDTSLYNCSSGAPPPHRTPRSFGVQQLDDFVARGTDEHTFTFLSIFKWEERKNWRELLTSFHATFPQNVTEITMEDGRKVSMTVRLLIKTQALSWGTDPQLDLDDLLSSLGASAAATLSQRLLIVKDSLSSVLMPSLYLTSDAFVLPTHGEGWGLPLMEAMASGLPTIATNWGGQTEFMNDDNAFVVDYDLVETNSMDSMGHMWAAPKAKDLRKAMWDVIARPSAARAKAQRGCREVRERYMARSVVQRAVDLIAELHGSVVKPTVEPTTAEPNRKVIE